MRKKTFTLANEKIPKFKAINSQRLGPLALYFVTAITIRNVRKSDVGKSRMRIVLLVR